MSKSKKGEINFRPIITLRNDVLSLTPLIKKLSNKIKLKNFTIHFFKKKKLKKQTAPGKKLLKSGFLKTVTT